MKWKDREEIWQWREAEEPIIISGFEGGAPGLWFSLTFLVVGFLTLLSGSSSQNWKPTDDGVGPTGMGLFFFGGALMAIGGWFLKTKWRIEELTPLPMLCERLGQNAAQVQQIAAERGVKPRYVVNGLEYYASSDFVDSESLLRAADSPEEVTETLLRPAALGETAPNELLRVPDKTTFAGAINRETTSAEPQRHIHQARCAKVHR